jgi:hypothetical protein
MTTYLTERDVAILVDVWKYHYLNLPQIQALHFPSTKTAYRRLQQLVDGKYIKSFTAPSIAGRIFYLHKEGAEVVAAHMQVTIDNLKWHRPSSSPKDYFFLRHFLAINDFRVAVTRACQNCPLGLRGFIPEYVGETVGGNVKKYLRDSIFDIQNPRQSLSHTPDAAFALEKDGKVALFFLEIDRGTETVSDPAKGLLKGIVFYLNLWVNGKLQRYEQDFHYEFKNFHTLIITTSQRRLQNIREAVTKYPFPKLQAKRFLWGATEVTKENLFLPIWQSMDATDQTEYKIG